MASNEQDGEQIYMTLRLIYIVFEVLIIFLLLFVLHNIYRYVIGLKMQKPLILTFYILVLLVSILRCISLAILIVNPADDYQKNLTLWYTTLLQAFVAECIELTLILTMHKLKLCLWLLMEEISDEVAQTSERSSVVFAVVYASFFFLFIIFALIQQPQKDPNASWGYSAFFVASFVCLTIAYGVVICTLNQVMRRMAGNFVSEIRSVNCQFFFFFLAYLARSLGSLLAFFVKADENYITDYPTATIVNTIVQYFVTQVLPIFMILLLHYRAFNPRTLKKNYLMDHIETENSELIQTREFEYGDETEPSETYPTEQDRTVNGSVDRSEQPDEPKKRDKQSENQVTKSLNHQRFEQMRRSSTSLKVRRQLTETAQGYQFRDAIRRSTIQKRANK